ncbi:protein of unknown function [Cyanobium sp. NIES-981]|nr:protein of unknown function [Cyanobium sp. NIES-981]
MSGGNCFNSVIFWLYINVLTL